MSQALYLASKRPKTSTRTVVALTVIQAAQLVALAVALVDDAQELDAEGSCHAQPTAHTVL